MSLSEQIERVDGSQNEILKTIVKAFGVTIGSEKIDGIASLAKLAANLKENGVLSNDTKTAFGLTTDAVPDDVLKILAQAALYKSNPSSGLYDVSDNLILKLPGVQIETGSYVGTGTYGSSNPNSLTFEFDVKAVFIQAQNFPDVGIFLKNNTAYAPFISGSSNWTGSSQSGVVSWINNAVKWWNGTDRNQFNGSTITYYYIAIG